VKFLVDRCAVRRLAAWLQDQGHDVHVAWEHVPDPGDAVLLEMAAQEGRVLVTIDTDFATPVYLHNAAHAGIVRLPDVPSDARIALMEEVLAGAIVTIRGSRIRFSRRPSGQ